MKGSLTLKNKSEVKLTVKHRSPADPAFIHVFSWCQGTIRLLEQFSQAAWVLKERQPAQWQLEELWHIRAKIQVIGIGEGGKSRRSLSPSLTDTPTLAFYSILSPPRVPHTPLFKHHWHSFSLVPALTGNRLLHTQRRSPSRGVADVAAIPVHLWLCVCLWVKEGQGGGWGGGLGAGGRIGGWIVGGRRTSSKGYCISCWGKSRVGELHCQLSPPPEPPQLVTHRLAPLTLSCYIIWRALGGDREGGGWRGGCVRNDNALSF